MTNNRWIKNTTGLVVHEAGGLETPYESHDTYYTPNDRFFVCSFRTPDIDITRYRLTIEGDGVGRPLTLTHDDLRAMVQRTVPAYLECAGNHRSLFETVLGEPLDKRPEMVELRWGLGAVGMAKWRGVRLRDVLALAEIKPDAVQVCPVGLDVDTEEGAAKIPMPVDKAMDPDTLLALEMNGEPLPPDHGFPVRVIAPGWVGTYSIKWVGSIVVSTEKQWVRRNTSSYVMMGPTWPAEDYAPALGPPVTTQTLKSSLALQWPARLPTGSQTVHGYARSPGTRVARVDWSADGGETWNAARLVEPNRRYAWVRFEFEWDAPAGEQALMTRATDALGVTQPRTVPFNAGGYLFNMIHPHPVVVG